MIQPGSDQESMRHSHYSFKLDDVFLFFARYYEGRNGWWLYDQRTNDEIDQAFRKGERRIEILIVGQVYAIDFENMHQYRLNDTQRRRRIKYDLISAPKKGVAGLKIDRQRFVENRSIMINLFSFIHRTTTQDRSETEVPAVPALISSVPSIIQSSLVAQISRSNADGQEPNSPSTNPLVPNDSNRNPIRQPADGLGNPNSTSTNWRTTNNREEHRHSAWSDDDDDDQRIPASERLRPVLIGGEDDSEVLSLINFRIDLNNE